MMHKIKYSYISSQVLRSQNVVRHTAEIKQAHLLGEQFQFQVMASLNHYHKHNILTPTMIQQIFRFLDSYDLDEAIRVVWLDCQSKGTDLKYLQHLTKEQRIEYLAQIQNLAVYFGQYQKQLMPIITGETSGSMASLVCTTPFQFFTQEGSIRFNDVNRGFVPHAGSTYHLSRLPDELGMYYGLTGRWLKQNEAINLGLIYGKLLDKDQAIDYINMNQRQYKYPITKEMYPYQILNEIRKFKRGYKVFLQKLSEEMISRMKTQDAQLVTQEILYKLKRFEEENIHNQSRIPKQNIANPYLSFKQQNIDQLEEMDIISRLNIVQLDRALISRCFSGQNIDDIMEKLKNEKSEFAQEILNDLKKQPRLQLDLTYQLIRNAEKLQWRDCLIQEHNVASNLINSGQIENQQKIQNLDSFFNQVQPQINYLQNALEPVKEFYEEYPDNIRYFLNEQNLRKGLRERKNQEIDVIAFMINNDHPIDQSIKVNELRKMRSEIAELKRDLTINLNKLKSLIGHEENLKKFINDRQNYLNNVKNYNQVLDQAMNNFFTHAHQARLNSYKHISEIATTKPKRTFFSFIRNALLNNKLTINEEDNDIESLQKQQLWLKSMNRLLIFPQKDNQSFFESQFPENVEQIKDKESKLQEEKSEEFRAQLYETRYGDRLQDFQQQLNKYYGRMINTVTDSNCENIIEYLQSNEEPQILQTLKSLSNEININIKNEEQNCQTQELLNEFKDNINQLNNFDKIKQDLHYFLQQNPQISKLIEQLWSDIPDQKPFSNLFERMFNKAFKVRQQKLQQLNEIAIIDDAINNSVILQSFNVIEDNLMFSFSYALILQLEEIFALLKHAKSFEVQCAQLHSKFGITIKTTDQFHQLLQYLNRSLQVGTTLYNTYRHNALLSSEKALDYLVTINSFKSPGFKEQAIYSNRIAQMTNNYYQRQIQALDGEFENQSTPDKLFTALARPAMKGYDLFREYVRRKKRLLLSNRQTKKSTSMKYVANNYEFKVYHNLLTLKNQKTKELVVGLHYQLRNMDQIAERQVTIIPKHIEEQKQQLQELLNRKWFKHNNIHEWFNELAEQTISELYHPEFIITEHQFKQALQMSLNSEKKLLEALRNELIFGIQNETDNYIQNIKFNPQMPDIQNLAAQMTVTEAYQQQGLLEDQDEIDALNVAKRGSIVKHGEDIPQELTDKDYRSLRTKMINRVESLVSQWSRQPKLIDQSDIDLLYEKIQQLQSKHK